MYDGPTILVSECDSNRVHFKIGSASSPLLDNPMVQIDCSAKLAEVLPVDAEGAGWRG